MDFVIRFIEKEKLDSIIPLLVQLNPKISADLLKSRLRDMVLQNYRCVGIFDDEELIGISGLWILTKYYIGKHIEPDNVFIRPEYQGKGIGERMINWIHDHAKSIGCEASELNCYTGNESGRRFWEHQGYEVVAYHFRKKIQ